jgi:hypothetical protein
MPHSVDAVANPEPRIPGPVAYALSANPNNDGNLVPNRIYANARSPFREQEHRSMTIEKWTPHKTGKGSIC